MLLADRVGSVDSASGVDDDTDVADRHGFADASIDEGWLPHGTRTRALLAAEATAPLALYRVICSARGGQAAVAQHTCGSSSTNAGHVDRFGAPTSRPGVPSTSALPLADVPPTSTASLSLAQIALRAAIEAHADLWERHIAEREASFEPLKRERRSKVQRPRG